MVSGWSSKVWRWLTTARGALVACVSIAAMLLNGCSHSGSAPPDTPFAEMTDFEAQHFVPELFPSPSRLPNPLPPGYMIDRLLERVGVAYSQSETRQTLEILSQARPIDARRVNERAVFPMGSSGASDRRLPAIYYNELYTQQGLIALNSHVDQAPLIQFDGQNYILPQDAFDALRGIYWQARRRFDREDPVTELYARSPFDFEAKRQHRREDADYLAGLSNRRVTSAQFFVPPDHVRRRINPPPPRPDGSIIIHGYPRSGPSPSTVCTLTPEQTRAWVALVTGGNAILRLPDRVWPLIDFPSRGVPPVNSDQMSDRERMLADAHRAYVEHFIHTLGLTLEDGETLLIALNFDSPRRFAIEDRLYEFDQASEDALNHAIRESTCSPY